MEGETGESIRSMTKRSDSLAWNSVYVALTRGAELVYHPKIKRYATRCSNPMDDLNGITISASFIKLQLQAKHSCLMRTGIDTYGIDPSRLKDETCKPREEEQMALF
jgi:hypothetical protein